MLENNKDGAEKDRAKFQKFEHTTTLKIWHDWSNGYKIDMIISSPK